MLQSSRKKKKTQINKIRNEKREVTADNTEIQRIIKDYYEQLYANKMHKYQSNQTTQANLKIQCNPYQITMPFFTELEQKVLQFVWKYKRP